MSRTIFPKDYIKEVLINEIKDITEKHPYLSFGVICSGVEYLGICLDDGSGWTDTRKSSRHFKDAIVELFPAHYTPLKDALYSSLRCGLIHSQLPGGYSLTEARKDKTGNLNYADHLIKDSQVIVIEYFYDDFKNACEKIIAQQFSLNSKMSKPFLNVD